MNDQQKRYCALNGDPVHMGLIDRVRTLPEYKVAGLATVFNLCVTASNATPEQMLVSVGGSIAGLVIGKGLADFYEWMSLRLWYGKNFRDLAVDKQPEGKTPPSSPEHLRAAENARWGMGIMSLATGNKLLLVSAYGLASAFGRSAEVTPDVEAKFQFGLAALGTLAGFCGVHFGVAAHRHHKIYKRTYAVTDMPPPQEEKQTAPVLAPVLNA